MLFLAAGQPAGQAEAGPPVPAEHQRQGLWIADVAFSPADIASATQQWDDYGVPNVLITFTDTGRAKFERVQQGRVGQVLEIGMDGIILSSPILREMITGNQVTISGSMTAADAAALARRLTPSRP